MSPTEFEHSLRKVLKEFGFKDLRSAPNPESVEEDRARRQAELTDKERMDWLEEFFAISSETSDSWKEFYYFATEHGFRYAIDQLQRRNYGG